MGPLGARPRLATLLPLSPLPTEQNPSRLCSMGAEVDAAGPRKTEGRRQRELKAREDVAISTAAP